MDNLGGFSSCVSHIYPQLEASIECQFGGPQPELPLMDGYQAELERQSRFEGKQGEGDHVGIGDKAICNM